MIAIFCSILLRIYIKQGNLKKMKPGQNKITLGRKIFAHVPTCNYIQIFI